MTHHDEVFVRAPAHVVLALGEGDQERPRDVRLVVRGQGTVGFILAKPKPKPFSVMISAGKEPGSPAFRWNVGPSGVELCEQAGGEWMRRTVVEGGGAGLDDEQACPYWFSVDCHNRTLGYGKGEMRIKTRIASYGYAPPPEGTPDPYEWVGDVVAMRIEAPIEAAIDVWRDPVTSEPALRLLPSEQITMQEIAEGSATVAANLPAACQILYANVAGAAFILDTPDFPDFSAAIEASINNPDGWCHKKLAAKAGEFDKKAPNPKETYLRITMGLNHGESPGVPFVMEIWPSGHYSPIHDHGNANAVIKVLHGSILVSLYPMLSPHHEEPFAQQSFPKGDVTWITPRLNQVHKLENVTPTACITIQCYLYDETNVTHYPYFDYLAQAATKKFVPNSDMGFLAFKALMKEEWARRCRHAASSDGRLARQP